jgi:hypothetical protein
MKEECDGRVVDSSNSRELLRPKDNNSNGEGECPKGF